MRIEENQQNVIVCAVGLNDANPINWLTQKQTPKEDLSTGFKQLFHIAERNNVKVAVIGLTPINENNYLDGSKFKGHFFSHHVEEYNRYIAEICETETIPYLDFYEDLKNNLPELLVDGIHPNDQGHKILFEKIKSFLNEHKLITYIG